LLAGDANVERDLLPSTAAEDFAYFLEKKPGAYIWIGNGNAEGAAMLQNPHYDFNDAPPVGRQLLGAARSIDTVEGCRRKTTLTFDLVSGIP